MPEPAVFMKAPENLPVWLKESPLERGITAAQGGHAGLGPYRS